jgi:RHS repeat-associated protein
MALFLVYATAVGTMPVRADELRNSYRPGASFPWSSPRTAEATVAPPFSESLAGSQPRVPSSAGTTEGRPSDGASGRSELASKLTPELKTAASSTSALPVEAAGPENVLSPLLECVVNRGGQYVAWFGYENDGSSRIRIPAGADNDLSVSSQGQLQAQDFLPGRQRFVFSAPFNNQELIWTLRGPDGDARTVRASKTSPLCAPVSNPGWAQTVNVGSTVQLDGSASSDFVGLSLTYKWCFFSIPAGSSAALSDPTAARPTFVADKSGTYTLQLVVNNGQADSTPRTVIVSTHNSPPVANAGPNQTVRPRSKVQVDGRDSTDVDGDALTYRWSLIHSPRGSTAQLSNPEVIDPTFVSDLDGVYTLQLIVNDGQHDSAPSTVTISTIASAPVANAGLMQPVAVGEAVELDGSASTDVDGNAITYRWSMLSAPPGSKANSSSTSAVKPSFVADLPGTYVAQLIVNDGLANSAPSTVLITSEPTTPVAKPGAGQTVRTGALVELDGSASLGGNGRPLTYQWSLLAKPASSVAALSLPSAMKPYFTADLPGNYVLQLVVSDGSLVSPPATVRISTSNSAPVANAGPRQTITLGSTATLSGAASSDADHDRLTYRWSLLAQPAGGLATLASPASASPSFVPKSAGFYVVQLIVNDGKVDSAPATTLVTVIKSASTVGGTPQTTAAQPAYAALNTGAPTITSLSPTSGPVGTAVTINGTGFGTTQGSSSVKFFGIVAAITSWSATTIVASVPTTAPTGSVNAKVWVGGVGSNEVAFTVLGMPSITKLSVNSGPVNSTVTITGTNFGATPGAVTFNGTAATPTSWSATSIVTTVPSGATTGNVVVSLSGVGSNGVAFMVVPAPQPPGANFIQGNYSTPGTITTAPVTYVAAQVAGDLNVVVVGWRDTTATVKSVADSAGNTYSLAVGPTTQISNGTQSIYYAKNIKAATAGGNTVTVTFSAAATTPDIRIAEYSGIDPNNPLDVSIGKETNGTTSTCGPVTTTNADDLLVAANLVQYTTTAAGSGYSSRVITTPGGDILEDQFVTATGGYSATAPLSASGRFIMQLVAFREAQNQAPVVNAGSNQTIALPTNSVTLNGTATDDGLPNHTLTIAWSMVSGPGTVTFSSPSTAVTQATFSAPGTYVLKLTANDSQLSSSSTTTVTVNSSANQPPVVSAGPNQSITLPVNSVALNGTATDDGLPNGTLILAWSKVSGPGPVTFASPTKAVTQVTFSVMPGAYVLQLSANDSQYTTTSQVTITVNAGNGPNHAPIVTAGPNQTLTLPASTLTLNGTATDDGLPSGILNLSWSQVSGPGSVTFSTPTQAGTQATFNAPGLYDLRLAASDTQLTSTADTFVFVYTSGSSGQNQPPYVTAGPDQSVVLPASVQLNGFAVDDGLPNGTLALSWSMVSGPGAVSFSTPNAAVTSASFTVAGNYVLQLAASDSVLVSTSTVNVKVGKLFGHMSNKGTDFWLMFPRNSDNSTDPNFQPQLEITSDSNTSGTVTVPGLNFSSTFSIAAGQSTSVLLPVAAAGDLSDVVENKGIHVTSATEITVVGFSFVPYSTDGYLALPTPVLGTDYVVPAYNQTFIGIQGPGIFFGGSEVAMVAAQDGTTVTITPPVATTGRVAAQPYQVILNQGRTYQLYAADFSVDLTGTQITSDKPIAVYGGASCANVPYDRNIIYKACNHLVEQIPPTDLWGQDFVVMPFATQTKGSLIRVLAAKDGTNLTVNGAIVATLNRGEFYDTITADPLVVNADKPVLTVQFMTSLDYQSRQENILGDPSMQLIPAYEQFGGQYIVVTPTIPTVTGYSGIPNNFLNIVVPTASSGSVQIDGAPIANATFSPLGSSTFSGAQVPTVPGMHHVTAAAPIGVSLYGMGDADAYSFQAGVVFDAARPGTTIVLTPKAVTQLTGTTLCLDASLLDPFGHPAGGIGVGFSVTGANPSSIYVDSNAAGIAQYCYIGTTSGADSIVASVGLASDTAALTWSSTATNAAPSVYAGAPQTITLPNTASLSGVAVDDGLPSGSQLSVTWSQISGAGTASFGNASQAVTTATFSAAGTYDLRLTATDTQLTSTSDVTITVVAAQQNQAPTVNAGANQTITLPVNLVTLNGTATDDGLPSGAKLAVQWTEVSGPSNANPVIFSSSTTLATQATLSTAGTYVLQLSADDSQLSAVSTVTITVIAQNQAPYVNPGGPYQTTLPNTSVTLNATVSDDGLPVGSKLTSQWAQVSGPAQVIFANSSQPVTQATFPVAGFYELTITATDTQLITSYNVQVTVYPANQPPQVSVNPASQNLVLPTNSVTLNGTVTDDGQPVGGTLTQLWTMQTGPAAVTFGTPTQPTTTVTFTAPGYYLFTLTASDSQLIGSAYAQVFVTGGVTVTNPNQPPVVYVNSGPTLTGPNATTTLNGVVTDDGLPYGTLTSSWTQVNGPALVTFANVSQPVTQATFPVAGNYQLRLTATDGQLTSTGDAYVSVNPATGAPSLSITPPFATVTLPANVTLTGNATDPNGQSLTYQWAQYLGAGPATFSAPTSAVTQVSFEVPGTYYLQLTASNSVLSTTATVAVSVIPPPPPGPPQVSLTTPEDGQNITAPTSIIGSVSPALTPNGTVNYTLAYSLNTQDGAATQNWVTIGKGIASVGINNGTLGSLDPTTLINGSYSLMLSATNDYGQTGTTTTSFTVSKNMKVGNFTLTFTDLAVPVSGLPITVTRTYDSRDQNLRDFGTSWSLGIANVQLQKNRVLGKSWNETFNGGGFTSYCLQSINNVTATVTFPDGRQYNFQAVSTPQCQQGGPITAPTVGFVELPGSAGTDGATLKPADGGAALVDNSVPGNVNLVDYNFQPYNPTVFILTTREGYKYTIDQQLGVTNMSDPNGNTLTISSTGIVSSTGKSVSFTRDSSNRITKITDPNGNTLQYAYNFYGLLYRFTDAVGNVTHFTYNGNQQGVQYLQQISDPRGVIPVTAYYDSNNHLQEMIDANGKIINYNNNLTGQVETITDRLGNPTTYSYDSDGNILTMTDALSNTTTYTYDSNDDKLTETNALGKTTSYTYDGTGNRLSETDPLGNKTTYTYDAGGRVLTVTDPQGHTTTNVYDGRGNLTSTTDANGKTTSTVYGFNGLPSSVTDANGKTTQFQYDGSGNLTQQTDALNNVSTYTYDSNNNKLSQTVTRTVNGQPQTITTNYKYDATNRLTETDYADGTKSQVQYNAIGKQSVTIDQLGRQTSYTYDTMGRLTATTYSDNTTQSATFDAENDRLTSVDRAGHTTTYTYDSDKRLTTTTYADQSTTQTNYDPAGRVSSTVDANGNSTTYGYDDAGRRTTLTDALTHVTTFAYDNSGNQIAVKDARQNTTQYQYDTLNRQIAVVYPDQTTSTTVYDALGRVTSKTDQAGKVTAYGYDALGRLTAVTQDAVTGGLNLVTTYGYDEVGNRISQTDANGHATTYQYDQLGRRISRTLPAGQSESYVYDSAGNLKTKTDFNGKTTTYAYDSNNRLLSKTPDASFNTAAIGFTYFANGLRQTMSDPSGTTTYAYDTRNRLTSKAAPAGTLNYTYDAAGDLLSLKSSNTGGTSDTYTYDALNRLSTVTDASGATTYVYDAVGNLQSFAYPNGVTHAYTYDPLNRLTQMGASKNANALSNYAYTLSAAGNRLTVAELGGRSVAYAYDSLYRLTTETVTADPHNHNFANGYTYDSVGNRKQWLVNGVVANVYTYDTDDRLGSDQYDANGNTTSSGGVSDAYDFENHLVQKGGLTIVYDGDGNRVSETVAGVTTNYLVDMQNPTGYAQVVDELQSGTVTRNYSYGLERISETQTLNAALTTSFFGYDGHGSVRQLTNSAGALTDTYDYDAFGNLVNSTGTTPNNYLFAGEQYDSALNLYYNRARYYNNTTGRFFSMDNYEGNARDPLSLHKYLYSAANPANHRDPSGNDFDLTSLTVSTSIITTLAGSSSTILATVLSGLFKGLPDAIGFGFLFAPEAFGGGFGSTLSAGPIGGLEIIFLPKAKMWELEAWGSPLEGTYSLPAPMAGPGEIEKGLFGVWYWNVDQSSNFTGIAGLALAGNFYGIEQSGRSTGLLFGISNDEDPALFGLATYSRVIASGTMSEGAMITAALGEESLLTIGSLVNYSESGVATNGLGGLAALVINNVAVGTWIDHTWGQQ